MYRVVLLICISLLPFSAVAQSVRLTEEPSEYHGDPYNAPVPETLTGTTVIADDDAAYELWESGEAVFVDVFPHTPRPANLPKGTLFREKKRHSIPGSLWLPNVGYDSLAPETDTYFRDGLKLASKDDLTTPIVIFCRADCWMSWNAAKRALEYGYTTVYWYPDGSDGWTFMEFETEQVFPYEN